MRMKRSQPARIGRSFRGVERTMMNKTVGTFLLGGMLTLSQMMILFIDGVGT